jgi:hypothetical protein
VLILRPFDHEIDRNQTRTKAFLHIRTLPAFDGLRSESRAAREAEELGLIILALGDRLGEIEPDRTHRRIPDDRPTGRGSDLRRVAANRNAGTLSEQRRLVLRRTGTGSRGGEIGLALIAEQGTRIEEERAFQAEVPGQSPDRELNFRRGTKIFRAAERVT